jgi:hypothetical protein
LGPSPATLWAIQHQRTAAPRTWSSARCAPWRIVSGTFARQRATQRVQLADRHIAERAG